MAIYTKLNNIFNLSKILVAAVTTIAKKFSRAPLLHELNIFN